MMHDEKEVLQKPGVFAAAPFGVPEGMCVQHENSSDITGCRFRKTNAGRQKQTVSDPA
jgi:hypothetical protein